MFQKQNVTSEYLQIMQVFNKNVKSFEYSVKSQVLKREPESDLNQVM